MLEKIMLCLFLALPEIAFYMHLKAPEKMYHWDYRVFRIKLAYWLFIGFKIIFITVSLSSLKGNLSFIVHITLVISCIIAMFYAMKHTIEYTLPYAITLDILVLICTILQNTL